jgi:phosphohistidine phosphatase
LLESVLAEHGVEKNRVVLGPKLPDRAAVMNFERIADVYLDTLPFSGSISTVDPLQLGIPVVACDGETTRSRCSGAQLRELGLSPDIVLVSSARRTLQTLEALQPLDSTPIIEVMDDLYLAPWQRLMETLRGMPETARSVLLIGHNPGLHELGLALMGPAGVTLASAHARRLTEGYPTGALAEFTIASHWGQLQDGGGRLVRFLAPRDLPEVAA